MKPKSKEKKEEINLLYDPSKFEEEAQKRAIRDREDEELLLAAVAANA